jgi:hypothetical protein
VALQLEYTLKHRRARGLSGLRGRIATLERVLRIHPLAHQLRVQCALPRDAYVSYSAKRELAPGVEYHFDLD